VRGVLRYAQDDRPSIDIITSAEVAFCSCREQNPWQPPLSPGATLSIDPTSGIPLYQQVANDLRQRIGSGAVAVGTQLPPHRQLAADYGVSIITINKALSGLVSEGVLYSRVGRGTFVAVRPAHAHVLPPRAASADKLLGFVLRDLSSPFFSLIAHAAQQHADALGYGLLFSSTSNRVDREEEQINRFRDLGAQGLIIVSMSRTYRLSDSIRALHDSGFPYVMVSYTEGDDVPFIGLDLDRAGYLVGEHFARLGRTRFGYAGDKFGSLLFERRMSGYRSAVEAHGRAVDPAFVFEYPYEGEWNDYRSAYEIGRHVASLSVRPDAMFVFNDIGAVGFQDAVLDAGLRVPDDIAIAGLDDIELAARARVPLTTVRQPTDRIGVLAVERILARIGGDRPPPRILLPPELVIRRSCGAVTGADLALARPRALRSLKDRAAMHER
jgi:LacI family transcriptional regulator